MIEVTQVPQPVEIDRIACDNIDRLMNVEMRSRVLPRGGKWPMFLMAREAAGMSLVEAAAREFYRPPCRVLHPLDWRCRLRPQDQAAWR